MEQERVKEPMKRILVAVHDEAMAVFLSEELMEEAYEVILCSDAVSLVRDIKRVKPDLILMDEEFGGTQKAILQKNIGSYLKKGSFIILWRGKRPESFPREADGFALSGFNLADFKKRIENTLEESPASRVPESRIPDSGPLIQTEFRWVKAD
jgi:DNA-binding NtrC family response regulator